MEPVDLPEGVALRNNRLHCAPIVRPALPAKSEIERECNRRICHALHEFGYFIHYENPERSGYVCCFGAHAEPPEGWRRSAAQEALDARALRAEG